MAELALAILPLVFAAIKGYRFAHEKLLTFHRCSKEVARVGKEVGRQELYFKYECELLLRTVTPDEHEARRMVKDANREEDRWKDVELETRLAARLQENYGACIELIRDIKIVLDQLQESLLRFDSYEKKCNDGIWDLESVPLSFRRLRDGFRIAFKKSTYDKWTEDLDRYNASLHRLRSYAREAQFSTRPPTQDTQKRTLVPSTAVAENTPNILCFREVQRAALRLHDTLIGKQTALNEPPSCIKVCLMVKAQQTGICLDLVICRASGGTRTLPTIRPFRQITVEAIAVRSTISTSVGRPAPATFSLSQLSGNARSEARQNGPKASVSGQCSQQGPSRIEQSTLQTLSLDIYQELLVKACIAHSGSLSCPGVLETPASEYSYRFHSSASCGIQPCCTTLVAQSATLLSLADALRKPVDQMVFTSDRLKLAKQLVLGVLHYHSTGWLNDSWTAEDVQAFSDEGDLSEAALRTLHYTKSLMALHKAVVEPAPAATYAQILARKGPASQRAISRRNLICAVYNLGLQLLRIQQWEPLHDLDAQRARELVESRNKPQLGIKFRDVARRCLDFNFGTEQSADEDTVLDSIYATIIPVLDRLIASAEEF